MPSTQTDSCRTSFSGYASSAPGKALTPFTYEPAALDDHDIEVEITHNGLCHTDIHMRDNDWGITKYPLIPGHEVIGIIRQCGTRVRHLSCGDRVGLGWIRTACRHCPACVRGEENVCEEGYEGLILKGNHGGFQRRMRVPAEAAFRIPEAISSEHAAPLMCAGATIYTPLRTYVTRPGMKVAVVGIGGLGHLALGFAAAMGCHVTALSTSDSKKEACLKELGAHAFQILSEAYIKPNQFDLILNTSPHALDYPSLLGTLRPNSTLVMLGVPVTELKVPLPALVFGQKSIAGSLVAGRRFMEEMLACAALHGIRPIVQTMPLSRVNEAMTLVEENKARYRIVLTTDETSSEE